MRRWITNEWRWSRRHEKGENYVRFYHHPLSLFCRCNEATDTLARLARLQVLSDMHAVSVASVDIWGLLVLVGEPSGVCCLVPLWLRRHLRLVGERGWQVYGPSHHNFESRSLEPITCRWTHGRTQRDLCACATSFDVMAGSGRPSLS